ncbi:hypothetical protein SPRG_15048 [Saprolegnia parasitica CBS 223.65]|uniref:SWIM-type domain-containing protein n=1 Tax=Saprolegnia parasitica (strain CBS 223.65) TaxID=695850 RepID=A0A067BS91_SAPPC|nr:hypothetical protein SPRG_15048 [Saprolegnia parasitica CBS 223.65]KDO19660.1 hypothetical protein SPRG_15048 [Saprolegnia parasitica CBS 223.65]|eukprot:XP_012209621.1 hypothetical protein SPRG_15048 [Saprolegnia parasitica CBS 223.65]
MAESHFRVFKDKFLAKSSPNWYDAKFKRASRPYGYDDPAAWENRFHAEWAAHCAKILAPLKEPANNDWTCSCPSYPYSEFLMCKHLVQAYIVDVHGVAWKESVNLEACLTAPKYKGLLKLSFGVDLPPPQPRRQCNTSIAS